ncbi:MAG: EF-hand domain-containing protein [Henriciella sp.]
MKKLALAAIIAGGTTLGVAGLAFADHHEDGDYKSRMIEKLDTNGDGAISKAEADAAKAARFAEADANGDGGLTMAELEAFHEAERERRREEMKQRMFARADANSDGVISIDEFDLRGRGGEDMFDRIDADDDGILTAEELEEMKGHHGKRRWGKHRGGDDQ